MPSARPTPSVGMVRRFVGFPAKVEDPCLTKLWEGVEYSLDARPIEKSGVSMETPCTVSTPPRIPRYVRDLNELAEARGITTSIVFGPDKSDPEIRMWSKWEGAFHQLESVGLLSRHQLALLMNASPRVRRRMVTVPGSQPPWCNPLLQGEIEVVDGRFEWRLDFGPGAYSIADRGCGDVEAVLC